MDSPAAPETPKQQKKVFFVNSPLKSDQEQGCIKAWTGIMDLVNDAATEVQKQHILDQTALFLTTNAAVRGLTFNENSATKALPDNGEDEEQVEGEGAEDEEQVEEEGAEDEEQVEGEGAEDEEQVEGEGAEDDDEPEDDDEDVEADEDPLQDQGDDHERVSQQAYNPARTNSQESMNIENEVQEIEKALDRLSIDIVGGLNREALTEMRGAFVAALVKDPVIMRRNNRKEEVYLTPPEVTKITNFFFSDVWGLKAMNRVRTLCKEYLTSGEEGFDGGLRQRAEAVLSDNTIPEACRNLVQGLSKTVQTNSPDSSVMRGFRNVCNFFELYQHYQALIVEAKKPSQELQAEWDRRNVQTSKGHSFPNQVQQYLIAVLQLSDRSQLSNALTQASLVSQFVDVYGRGILVLLPGGAPRNLQKIGVSRVARGAFVWGRLSKDYHREILEMCEYIEEHIYVPMVNGELLKLDIITGGSSKSFMTRLEQARLSKRAIANAENDIDVEMGDEE